MDFTFLVMSIAYYAVLAIGTAILVIAAIWLWDKAFSQILLMLDLHRLFVEFMFQRSREKRYGKRS